MTTEADQSAANARVNSPRVLDELAWRGLIAQSTDLGELRQRIDQGPITVYCGFDPTAPSLHFGNFVQLVVLRHFQRAGHRVICLVGGSTGLIGDPKPSAERTLRSKEATAANVARIKELVKPFLDFEGSNPAILVDNLDWTAPMSALDFLRDIGKHFRVNQMIRKDAVAARLQSQEGISYTEFSYQLLQALDYLHLYRNYDCVLQTGGSDQWGNLTAGVDLVHRVEGASVHALTTPLLTDANGQKFGKSEGNAIWLSGDMTTPYAFYQYFLNVEDSSVVQLLKVFTDLDASQIEELERSVQEAPQARTAQRTLARAVTSLVHGSLATQRVEQASTALFGRGDLAGLDTATLADALAELPRTSLPRGVHAVVDLLAATDLVPSKSAARRAITEGGAHINNVKITDVEAALGPSDLIHDRWWVLRRGRRSLAVVEVTD